jgi:hypothetical protein
VFVLLQFLFSFVVADPTSIWFVFSFCSGSVFVSATTDFLAVVVGGSV